MYRRHLFQFAAALSLATGLAGPALAGDAPIYTGLFSSVAVSGHDPVAYFTDGKPVKGDAQFETTYKGAKWRFASAAHRDLFLAEPDKYAPQYGGYCAWAVAEGGTASGDPRYWKIVDGKLYLNYDADVQKKWEKDIPGNIGKANRNWPSVLGK
ncbi:MAG: YHS domain-containing protein [Ramlibacter sp.]|nr:YHS domain-containing protein [Ramlibacter sp.]MBX3657032.1 YHS domain-containing protein [Ramlibacter sp.]MCW5651472.1 YHS domain-containing protein [Ramlibacter sp.]